MIINETEALLFSGKPAIHINQLGYRPEDEKIVRYVGNAVDFCVVDSAGSEVMKSCWSAAKYDRASGQPVRKGDISALNKPGRYKLVSGDGTESCVFEIGAGVFEEISRAVLDMFYYQRCGTELESAGKWAHTACHTAPATVLGTQTKLDVSGGWHDAGDYNRYVSAAGTAVADLLLAHELFGVSGVLDEVRYELEWMLKMQDSSGAVYHKVTTREFGPLCESPEQEEDELYLTELSPTATGNAAACFAMAARLYAADAPEFAALCLEASQKAYIWLESNPGIKPVTANPDGIRTGIYGDDEVEDEIFWATAELYKTTGAESYHTKLKGMRPQGGLGWANVGMYGVIAYLTAAEELRDAELREIMREKLLSEASGVYEGTLDNEYGISTIYKWGSNMIVGKNAQLLLLSHLLAEENRSYEQAALEHLNYLLGCNVLSQCYVSGFGAKPMRNPHHRPSAYVGEAVPGMVSGGPNSALQDYEAKQLLQGLPPAMCYADLTGSYSTNEVAIYWNSPVVFVLGYFNRTENKNFPAA